MPTTQLRSIARKWPNVTDEEKELFREQTRCFVSDAVWKNYIGEREWGVAVQQKPGGWDVVFVVKGSSYASFAFFLEDKDKPSSDKLTIHIYDVHAQ